ncbi:hypothetical protein D9M70_497640 [compost metagenome]
MVRAAGAGGAIVEAALRGLRLRDEFPGAFHRAVRADHQDHREAAQQRDRGEVLARMVGKCLVQDRVEHQRAVVGGQHRIAVGGRARRLGRADRRVAAGLVVHHDRLADLGRQPLADGAREEVRAAAGGVRHDPADRLGGVGVGGVRRQGGQQGQDERADGANGQARQQGAGHGVVSDEFLFCVNLIRIA